MEVVAPGGGGMSRALGTRSSRSAALLYGLPGNGVGKRYRWKQPREGALVGAGVAEPAYAITAFELAAAKSAGRKATRRRRAS